MPPNATTRIAGFEPTYSAREAAALLRRSYSWLDQRLRGGEFAAPDGSVLEPLRAANGYRYFSIQMLWEVATYCYRRRWYSFDELKTIFRELAIAEDDGTVDPRGSERTSPSFNWHLADSTAKYRA
ncbi:hypothetical protein [Mycobacterium colombiense]|uniref:DUF7229 domain-containing protein n=1 Tax=Mycobacterium colombiense TaxID=339268 RepID=UPI000A86A2FF